MGNRISLYSSVAASVALLVGFKPVQPQIPMLDDAGVGMGHLHLLVGETDYDAHRRAWVDGLGARPASLGPLEVLLLPGVVVLIRKGDPVGGSEGSSVNHLGFLVRDLEARLEHWRGLGLEVYEQRPSLTQAFLRFPGEVKVELTEDPTLPTLVAHHHIHLYTTEVVATREWYVETFGGTAGKRGQFEEAWFPGVRISIGAVDTRLAGTQGRAVDHIGFEVDGLQALCRRLEAAGVEFDVPYREVPSINTSIAFLTDPWGTYIELTEGLDELQ